MNGTLDTTADTNMLKDQSVKLSIPQVVVGILRALPRLIIVFLLLYIFLVSIKMMGGAFKGFGKGFATQLLTTTQNPFVGLFIGILATSLIQSSSTTTSIVVGIVGAGTLPVSSAIPVIMGANIGTTVTNTMVSLGHVSRRDEFRRAISAATVHDFFNLICVAIMFPLEMAFHFLERGARYMSTVFEGAGGYKFVDITKVIVKPAVTAVQGAAIHVGGSEKVGYIIMLILSVILLFLSLYFIVKVMKALVVNRAEIILDNVISRNAIVGLIAGLLFTIVVQSSSITTSLLIPLVASGILTIEAAFPMTIGANIGTTTTAILASFATGNPAGIVIAFSHFLFNVIGTLVIYPIKIFRTIPISLAKSLGDMAAEKRWMAFLYVLTLFFLLPGLLILISKLFM